MKKIILLFVVLIATSARAGGPVFEIIDEARQRHSDERYEVYQQNRYQAPLGGYRETLGDPAPYGTDRPGYTSPQPYGFRRYGDSLTDE